MKHFADFQTRSITLSIFKDTICNYVFLYVKSSIKVFSDPKFRPAIQFMSLKVHILMEHIISTD